MGARLLEYNSLEKLRKFLFFLIEMFFFKNIKLGAYIRKPLKIVGKNHIELGKSLIERNARIEAVTNYQNIKFNPRIIIKDEVSIQQNLHLTCADEIIIEKGTSITANVGIFDITHPYKDISINPRNQKIETAPIYIGENSLIGMNSVILPGTTIGRHCIVGALSLCKGNYQDYSVITGIPAVIVKRYNFDTQQWEKTNPDGTFINYKK